VCAWSTAGSAVLLPLRGRSKARFQVFFSNKETIAEHSTRVYAGMRRDKHGDQPHQRISTFPTFNFHIFPFFRQEAVGDFSRSIRHAPCLSTLLLVYRFQITILLIGTHHFMDHLGYLLGTHSLYPPAASRIV